MDGCDSPSTYDALVEAIVRLGQRVGEKWMEGMGEVLPAGAVGKRLPHPRDPTPCTRVSRPRGTEVAAPRRSLGLRDMRSLLHSGIACALLLRVDGVALSRRTALAALVGVPNAASATAGSITSQAGRRCKTDSNPAVTVVTCLGFGLQRDGRLAGCAADEACISSSAVNNPSKFACVPPCPHRCPNTPDL